MLVIEKASKYCMAYGMMDSTDREARVRRELGSGRCNRSG